MNSTRVSERSDRRRSDSTRPLIPGMTTSASSRWIGVVARARDGERFLAVRSLEHGVAGLAQRAADQRPQPAIVFGEQHRLVGAHGSPPLRRDRRIPPRPAALDEFRQVDAKTSCRGRPSCRRRSSRPCPARCRRRSRGRGRCRVPLPWSCRTARRFSPRSPRPCRSRCRTPPGRCAAAAPPNA